MPMAIGPGGRGKPQCANDWPREGNNGKDPDKNKKDSPRAQPPSIVTAHSLKSKYTLTALAFGITFALLLAIALLYQYRGALQRQGIATYTALEGRIESDLNQRAEQVAREFA